MDLEIFHKNKIFIKGKVFFKNPKETKNIVYLDYNSDILRENFTCNKFGYDKIHSVLTFEIFHPIRNTSIEKLIKKNDFLIR